MAAALALGIYGLTARLEDAAADRAELSATVNAIRAENADLRHTNTVLVTQVDQLRTVIDALVGQVRQAGLTPVVTVAGSRPSVAARSVRPVAPPRVAPPPTTAPPTTSPAKNPHARCQQPKGGCGRGRT